MLRTALIVVGILSVGNGCNIKSKRSIDLSASHALIPDARLSKDVIPRSYELNLRPNLDEGVFAGNIKMNLSWKDATKKISLHAHYDLQINERTISLKKFASKTGGIEQHIETIPILRADRLPKRTVYVIYLKNTMDQGSECELEIEFEGHIWETTEGLFKGTYSAAENKKHEYLATYMRPHNARRLFPCFDEPGFKVRTLKKKDALKLDVNTFKLYFKCSSHKVPAQS